MSNIPGKKVIKEILNGNEKLLKKVYKKVYINIERYAKSVNLSTNNAKESVQDAFEIFYRQALSNEIKLKCSLETYITAIARRVLLKEARDWSDRLKDNFNPDDTIDDIIELKTKKIKEKKHELFTCEFKKLSTECQNIISLTLQGYNLNQINQKLHYDSVDYLKMKRSRCKRYLIEKIKQNPDYEELRNTHPEDYELPA